MLSQLDDLAEKILSESGPTNGMKLYNSLKAKYPALNEFEFADLIWRLARRGLVELHDEPTMPRSYLKYLKDWKNNCWYFASVIVSLITGLVAYNIPQNSPLVVLRWGLGLIFVLYLPGYVTIKALFPGRELKGLERFIVSLGASLILDMLIGLLLNYTSLGIRLVPILLSLTAFTIFSATVAVVRQFMTSTLTHSPYSEQQ